MCWEKKDGINGSGTGVEKENEEKEEDVGNDDNEKNMYEVGRKYKKGEARRG